MGEDAYVIEDIGRRCIPVLPNTTADRAGDLLASASALTYLQGMKTDNAPEAARLTERIRGLVSELISLQNDDGGWPWVAGTKGQARPSDRMTSARVTSGQQRRRLRVLEPPARTRPFSTRPRPG